MNGTSSCTCQLKVSSEAVVVRIALLEQRLKKSLDGIGLVLHFLAGGTARVHQNSDRQRLRRVPLEKTRSSASRRCRRR